MADLAVITPSRGRPNQLINLYNAIQATSVLDTKLAVLVDDDDPELSRYEALAHLPGLYLKVGPRGSLSSLTNLGAEWMLGSGAAPSYLASLGDDHRPRTKGWDRKLIGAIESLGGPPGFAYGNDLFQGANVPTAWVVSAEIVRALGWMMLPTAEHMYVDNAVLELGRATGRILYRPGVIIEHLHPVAGKADWDASYRETNTSGRYAADRAAFEAWRADGLAADAAVVASLTVASLLH